MHADLILTHGRVYTMDATRPQAEAVAVTGNHILDVGSAADIASLRGPQTQVIDLDGRPLLPAFADSHVHFVQYALARQRLDLSHTRAAEEVAALVAQRAASTPPGDWLHGSGWDRHIWRDPTLPGKALLDAVAPGHPVALDSKDLHSLWVNSLALARAGITAATPDPPGGVIVRDPHTGEPTGILLETACELVTAVYPPPSPETCARAIRAAIPLAWAAGITSIHQMGDAPDGRAFRAFQFLNQSGELGLRVLIYLPQEHLEAARAVGLRSGFGDRRLRLGGIKLFADGSLGSHTAWMLEPFQGEPSNCGVGRLEPDELRALVRQAGCAGLGVAVHAIGDRANREASEAIAAARQAELVSASAPELRHRIEHVQLLHPDDIPRLAQCRIIASMQPTHCTADMEMADRHWGEPRCAGAYAWRSLLDTGAVLAFGSDAPVEALDVLAGIHAAVTRRRPDGSPGPEGWHPEQRLSVAEAVHAYTLGAAYAAGEERWRGSISAGKLADLVVLSDDIFTCDPMDILAARVDITLFDGQVVHWRQGEGVRG
ncbi:MAG: amidohydrolase [Anaerolineae bacterium]|nr:amidohydrolase [Anaerolineae bacterium]